MEKGGNTCFSEQNVFPSTSVNHEDIGLNEKEPPQTSQAFLNSLPDAHLPTTRKGLACDRQTATVTPAKTKKLEILYKYTNFCVPTHLSEKITFAAMRRSTISFWPP